MKKLIEAMEADPVAKELIMSLAKTAKNPDVSAKNRMIAAVVLADVCSPYLLDAIRDQVLAQTAPKEDEYETVWIQGAKVRRKKK